MVGRAAEQVGVKPTGVPGDRAVLCRLPVIAVVAIADERKRTSSTSSVIVAIPIYPILWLPYVDSVCRGKSLAIIFQVGQHGKANLARVVQARDAIGPLAGPREDWQQERSQEGHDGHDN